MGERRILSASEIAAERGMLRDDMDRHAVVTRLYSSLVLPSYVHGYSVAIEYMYKWFTKRFSSDYFRGGVYIDAKNVLDEYKQLYPTPIKRENPRARIGCTVDTDFDREDVDVYIAPPELLLRRSQYNDSFFKDYDRNMYLGFASRAMRMNFNFKVRVNSRAKQLDLLNQMELYFRIGSTQFEYISVDFHIPKQLVLYIAERAGFKVVAGEVEDTLSFLQYMNQHSDLPVLFKIRAINQQAEYFIRMNDIMAHIKTRDKLQKDDGERDGKLDFNFHVEMDAELTMLVPHFYALYDEKDLKFKLDTKYIEDNMVPVYSINVVDPPKTNERGWGQAAITSYQADEDDIDIDLSAIFKGDNVLTRAVANSKKLGISPDKYIDIVVYSNIDVAKTYPIKMDWETYKAKYIRGPLPRGDIMQIAIYYDREYINDLDITLGNYNNTRVGYNMNHNNNNHEDE